MNPSQYIANLTAEIAETESRLSRLRLKLEIAREMACEMAEHPRNGAPVNANRCAVGANRYAGLKASDAILRLLADMGTAPRKTLLDTLQGQIQTRSDKPRNIVRNCLTQLAERGKVLIDDDTNVSLSGAEAPHQEED